MYGGDIVAKTNMVGKIAERITPLIEECGYEVWNISFDKEGSERYFRVEIDSDDGITLDDCTKVSDLIDPILDEIPPSEEPYHLEVSSAGIERELKKPSHIEAFAGSDVLVDISFFAPKNGKKQIRGTIESYSADSDEITVAIEGESVRLKRSECAKIKTVFDFGDYN